MYPRAWFDTYWRGTLKPEVFVAMPFSKEFGPIFENAIKPAIEKDLDGGKYSVNRVDIGKLSPSIITRILDGIGHATLIFADISVATSGKWKGQRNGNVMYEVGLAHALRPDTDVVLVKSDRASPNFDIGGIKINNYAKKDFSSARLSFARLLADALDQRGKMMSLIIERARVRLDLHCLNLMTRYGEASKFKPFVLPDNSPVEDRVALWRLLDLEIITCVIPQNLHYEYRWTDFGKEVYWKPNLVSHQDGNQLHPYPTQNYSNLNKA